MSDKENYGDAQWREQLSPEQYRICRLKGTEAPFTGEYWNVFNEGVYRCRCCAEPLFESGAKFDAGCGWPSFNALLAKDKIQGEFDTSHGMRRTEVLCRRCGCHLGHVFPDGPAPTGLRYCINSASIAFHDAESEK